KRLDESQMLRTIMIRIPFNQYNKAMEFLPIGQKVKLKGLRAVKVKEKEKKKKGDKKFHPDEQKVWLLMQKRSLQTSILHNHRQDIQKQDSSVPWKRRGLVARQHTHQRWIPSSEEGT